MRTAKGQAARVLPGCQRPKSLNIYLGHAVQFSEDRYGVVSDLLRTYCSQWKFPPWHMDVFQQKDDPITSSFWNKLTQQHTTGTENQVSKSQAWLLPRERAGENQADKAFNPPSLTNFQDLTYRSSEHLSWRGNSEWMQASVPSNTTTAGPSPCTHSCPTAQI